MNDACQQGHVSLPIGNDYGQKYPIIQYADDTLMIMPPDVNELQYL
jgi:hypothetical protein